MAPLHLVANEIADLTALFETTGNRAAAWRAYSLARESSRPIPVVIQREIDRFALSISTVAKDLIMAEVDYTMAMGSPTSKRRAPKKRSFAFGSADLFAAWRGDGPKNPMKLLQTEWRDIRVCAAVHELMENGMGVGEAQETVGQKAGFGLSFEAVRKIWKKHLRRDRVAAK